ncbi:RHS repeat-associated core domain-containing protein [Variovorax sp. H27-G14]|uniref:RHS repeat-associated core domain-containing protein n=1 Tax=Variovorax sp. H27-G14 TaxID=3111914 RepID=UPI0038FC72E8
MKFNLRYPGQYADEESGLFYNGFRTYSPTTGRYTQGDPIGLDGGWNRFGYAGANPLSYVDPDGLQRSRMLRPYENQIFEAGGGVGGGRSIFGGGGRASGSRAGGGAKLENISPGDARRIQNAADRTGTPICVVESRANGTARPASDWDYVIPPTASRSTAHSLKSSLPDGPRGLGEPRNLDLWRDTVNAGRPHIIFPPN